MRGGTETILVVEDEAPVREFVTRLLSEQGYSVLDAGSGGEALETWERHRDEISMVLTDIIMPEGMSGADLARRLRQECPSLKIMFMSGYSVEFAGRNLELVPNANFIQKPYRPQELLRTVRQFLDSPAVGLEAIDARGLYATGKRPI